MSEEPKKRGFPVRGAVLLLAMAVPMLLLWLDGPRAKLVELMTWLRTAGSVGVVAFYGMEIVLALALAPVWLGNGIAGFVWGFPFGLVVAVPGLALSATAAFFVGRGFLGQGSPPPAISERLFRAILRATEHHGFKITALLRATPVMPQNLLSYLLGATKVRGWEFAAGTALGMVPMTILHVYVGSIAQNAAELAANKTEAPGPVRIAMWTLIPLLSIVGLVVVSRVAKKELDKALAEDG